jgi:endonuclease/exonuclease/phosphatase family metal-dependent hydrolase
MSEGRAGDSRTAGANGLIGGTPAPGLHVMSYNVRRIIRGVRHGSPDFWPGRRELVGRLLRAESPSILGVQEAMASQATAISGMLPGYKRIGHGRNADGRGEGCPVFYDPERVRLERWSQLALSPTPLRQGSRGWGNMVPRVALLADFVDRDTGDSLTIINTHFDHLSKRSRVRSAEMIAGMVTAAERPAIVMGDFNTAPGTAPYRVLLESGLRDTWVIAAERRGHDGGTYSGFKAPNSRGRRIDWLLATPDLTVSIAAINAARYGGRAPSDHEPVQAVVTAGTGRQVR